MSRAQSATSSRTTGRGGRSATVVPIKRGQRQPKVPEVSHPCAACTRENVSVEATSYCKDCEENLCANCIKQHSKFASMKTHVIMSGPPTNSGDKGPQTTPFSCPYHPEKTVDMYCVKHDEVLCGACIAVNHKDCECTLLLDEAAKGFKTTDEFKEVKDETLRAKKNMIAMTKQAGQQLATIEKRKNKLLNQVKEARKKIEKVLDQMEYRTILELEQNCKSETTNTQSDIKMYDDIINGINDATKLFTAKEKGAEETEIFVGVKKAKTLVKDSDRIMTFIKHNFTYEPPRFTPDSRINNWLKTVGVLGEFSFRTQAYSAEYLNKYQVKLIGDKKDCDIFGCKFLDNGQVVITDWDNRNVKLLDKDFQIVESIVVDGCPNDVCLLNPNMVAVTMPMQKIVQLIEVAPQLSLNRQIVTEDTCRGIDCFGDLLYVACGGFKGDSDGRILVYSITGDLLRAIERNNSGQRIFSCPIAVTVACDGTMLYVSDGQRGVITMTIQNDVVSIVRDKDSTWPCGICIDRKENVLVCCGRSNNIIQITGLNKIGRVLTQNDGIKEPHAICYDANNMRLLVTLKKSNHILLYHLKNPDMKSTINAEKEKFQNPVSDQQEVKATEKTGTDRKEKPSEVDKGSQSQNQAQVKENPDGRKVQVTNEINTSNDNSTVKNERTTKGEKTVLQNSKVDDNEKVVKIVGNKSAFITEANDEESLITSKLEVVLEDPKETQSGVKKVVVKDAKESQSGEKKVVDDPKKSQLEEKKDKQGTTIKSTVSSTATRNTGKFGNIKTSSQTSRTVPVSKMDTPK